MRAWPAAKYLTYCFWRSWILVVYTAPIWSYVANGTGSASCSFSMYAWSTVAFALVAALLALFHEKASLVLARKGVMCLAGVISSVGMLMEYAGAFLFSDGANLLFVSGALLTGVGTAFIAVRAGQIYAATRPVVAVTNTALSELASGLVFFFVVGTVPQIALLVAALLPLAAALMTLFESDADATRGLVRRRAADIDAATRRASVFAFARFLVVVFLLTFMANLSKGAFALQDAEASLASGAIGVSLVILVSFVLVLAQIVRFRRGVLPARAHARAGRGGGVLVGCGQYGRCGGDRAGVLLVLSVHVVLADVFGSQRLLEFDSGVRVRTLGFRARFVGRARRGAGLPACRDGWL